MIKVFEATYNSDSMEGRGYTVHAGLFLKHQDAVDSVADRTDMGGRPMGEIRERQVYDSLAEYRAERNRELVESALTKLSVDERRALGYE
jgi:hypothetical protein